MNKKKNDAVNQLDENHIKTLQSPDWKYFSCHPGHEMIFSVPLGVGSIRCRWYYTELLSSISPLMCPRDTLTHNWN